MKRDVVPVAGTVEPSLTARTSIQYGAFFTHLYGVAPCLEPADFEHRARLAERHPIGSKAITRTLGIELARKVAANFDGDCETLPFSADPEKTSLEKPRTATDRVAMGLASRGQACGSVRSSALTDGTQRLKCSRLRFKTPIARAFTTVCVNRVWARAAAGLTDICYLPSSHELHGYFLGLLHPFFWWSWRVRRRGTKSPPPPFV